MRSLLTSSSNLRLFATIVLLIWLGGSAYAHVTAPVTYRKYERGLYTIYAWAFALFALANWITLLVSIHTGSYERGPWHVGLGSLLIPIIYVCHIGLRSTSIRR